MKAEGGRMKSEWGGGSRLRLESNPRLWRRFWRRREKWAQLLVQIAQGRIMEEERAINLREPFHHGAVRGQLVAAFENEDRLGKRR